MNNPCEQPLKLIYLFMKLTPKIKAMASFLLLSSLNKINHITINQLTQNKSKK